MGYFSREQGAEHCQRTVQSAMLKSDAPLLCVPVCVHACRAMAELDIAEQEMPTATFSNGANARTGTIPVNYDPERKKMTWYYFMGTAMTEAEMVRCPALSGQCQISSCRCHKQVHCIIWRP